MTMKSLCINICLLIGLSVTVEGTAQYQKQAEIIGNRPHRIQDQGIFYGLSTSGGDRNGGVLFSFQPSLDTVYNHFSFPKDADPDIRSGAMPVGPLVKTRDGKIFGNTLTGGLPYPNTPGVGYGTIYYFDTSGNSHSKIWDYDLVTGGLPYTTLTEASDGLLYGTYTEREDGIFSLDPSNHFYRSIFEFPLFSGTSRTPLIESDSMKLFGTLWSDRYTDSASIFSYDLIRKQFSILYTTDFNDLTVISGANGKLYWIRADTLFCLNTLDNSVFPVYIFRALSGNRPSVSISRGGDKKIYGTTREGGDHGYGVIFSFDPLNDRYENLYNVTPTDVFFYDAPLTEADNKLYGYAGAGIHAGIFSFDLKTRIYKKAIALNRTESPAGRIWLTWFPAPACLPPVVAVRNNGPACEGSTVTFSASGAASYEWTGPGNYYSTLANPVIQQVNLGHEGVYYVRATSAEGCSVWDSTILSVYPLPSTEIQVSGELSFCAGDSVTLAASDGGSWLWSTGDTTRSVTLQSSGIYSVTIAGENGCSAESSALTVSVNEIPGKPVINRNGNELSASEGYQWYEWFLNDQLIVAGVSNKLVPDKPGIYRVRISDANTCTNISADLLVGISGNPLRFGNLSIYTYPNPARSFFTIYIQNNSIPGLQIQVINNQGMVTFQKNLTSGYNLIDIRNLPSGIYFIRFTDGKQTSTRRLIIY